MEWLKGWLRFRLKRSENERWRKKENENSHLKKKNKDPAADVAHGTLEGELMD